LAVLAAYEQLKAQQDELNIQQQGLQKEFESMSVWGDFDLEMIEKLRQAGMALKFYSCRERDFQAAWQARFDTVQIAVINSLVYFVAFTPVGTTEEPDAEKIRLSSRSLSQLASDLNHTKAQLQEIDIQLNQMAAAHLNNLKEARRQINERIDLNKVHLQTEKKADNYLMLLEGWVPEIREVGLLEALGGLDVYYVGVAPAKDDNSVPVLLKNNRFARLFEPVGELYDMPNYHELDLTPMFAPFFLMFFGLCLGDAGYGLLLLTAALLVRPKAKPAMKPLMNLVACLGVGTMVFGAISGTFFGIPLLDMDWAWLTSFKNFMLNPDQLFNLALIIGAVQIIFGMFVKVIGQIRRYGWAYSLETWGWLILILGIGGLYLADKNGLLPPDTVRYTRYGVLGISGVFILLLNMPGRNPFINIGAGLWNSYNMVTGLMGDLLSYIRLFALGISGSVMGLVFNQLAVQMSGNIPVVSWIIMLIILIIGHSLNIFMSGLGAFVHPMRLTFVEFYKNSGFEGGGKKYKPFKPYKE
jgi:V/A-type H+-transporting ATPase subunit I